MTKMKAALAAGAAALAMAGAANATVFNLVQGPPGCACGAVGTVTVAADGTALDGDPTFMITVNLTAGALNLAGGGFDATGFDVNGITTVNFGSVSPNPPFSAPASETAGTNMEDGLGDYQFIIDRAKGNNGGSNPTTLSYLVSAPGLTLSDFVTNGTGGTFFVDVIGPNGATGVEGTGPGVSVPEPATWAMMLLGVFGVGGLLRRRREMAIA